MSLFNLLSELRHEEKEKKNNNELFEQCPQTKSVSWDVDTEFSLRSLCEQERIKPADEKLLLLFEEEVKVTGNVKRAGDTLNIGVETRMKDSTLLRLLVTCSRLDKPEGPRIEKFALMQLEEAFILIEVKKLLAALRSAPALTIDMMFGLSEIIVVNYHTILFRCDVLLSIKIGVTGVATNVKEAVNMCCKQLVLFNELLLKADASGDEKKVKWVALAEKHRDDAKKFKEQKAAQERALAEAKMLEDEAKALKQRAQAEQFANAEGNKI